MSFTLTPAPLMLLSTPAGVTTGPARRLCHGQKRWSFLAGIWSMVFPQRVSDQHSMRYGIFYLPSLTSADRENAADRLHSIVEQAAYGEELGFTSVWLAEHHFHSFGGIL